MSPDPKWLELLKASGWQTLAIATGCSLTYALISRGIIPNPGALAILFVVVLGLICACLTLPNILSRLARTFPILKWIKNWESARRARRSLEDHIPFMSARDRMIVGYLLANNLKSFTVQNDGP